MQGSEEACKENMEDLETKEENKQKIVDVVIYKVFIKEAKTKEQLKSGQKRIK